MAELSVDRFITGVFSFSKSLRLKSSILTSKSSITLYNFGGFKSLSFENGDNSNIYFFACYYKSCFFSGQHQRLWNRLIF